MEFSEGFDCHEGKQSPDVQYSNNRACVQLLRNQWKKSGAFMFCLSSEILLSDEIAVWMFGFGQKKDLWKAGEYK